MQTPLHIAAEGGHSYLLEALLKKGAAVNLADDERNTPLHCVGGMGGGEDDKEVIKLLLKAGADINLVNAEGDTPLSSYDLRSSHLSTDMKLMIVHITKLKAAGLFINQQNIQFTDELVRFWRGRNNNFL
ncbi:ankyrin repeat domain-containing protein [Wolbachia endosymbiont of Diaphorina citri]|jgi:FOG: Ankyrin repeat|uniref:ankyrin repeat domain-containing protein n=1 Tax=Wolbachia endosymbiont of Diaphorina citri TaxID=116598 RepID=UPI000A03E8D8|nr:ankyrin repeat domain-containing protein [Wolbachia endosymbiont of Diaphorina citri]QJT94336.1 ankyrin repeat domain-containing protein [Wolbachia endosymbiont of Diaphorina citri]QJT95576.1 ankyrin repeat domain-containing protein [Wolbachia endosymbiont of Diaphorina citri]QJT96938.1 ankyrin repeat domain-containing protein [Wolbachia endosymbiont of Diaphorina citri]QLK11235.1 ankyrin repeat domain-containing protein [Wolbachia endosymbiont of Diaphorina citri]QXY87233.1 ankyrin repeat 